MKLRSVKDIREFLTLHRLSPERFSDQCGISNMTVRRWLKTDDSNPIPSKYWPIFDHAFAKIVESEMDLNLTSSFADGFQDLEKEVHQLGENEVDEEKLKNEFSQKASDQSIPNGMIEKAKALFQKLQSKELNPYNRSLALGALVYFINPIDLIPDTTLILGYLDDYSVMTMTLTRLTQAFSKK